jgi:hypothetical protein
MRVRDGLSNESTMSHSPALRRIDDAALPMHAHAPLRKHLPRQPVIVAWLTKPLPYSSNNAGQPPRRPRRRSVRPRRTGDNLGGVGSRRRCGALALARALPLWRGRQFEHAIAEQTRKPPDRKPVSRMPWAVLSRPPA